jgi:very-short-patch-repair endonuclease
MSKSKVFSSFVKGIMRRYVKSGKYSPEEKVLEKILNELGLKRDRDFFHNYRFRSDKKRGYFWVDFFLPKWHLIIEIDGGIWHKFFKEAKEKDRRRDKWFKRIGFQVLRIESSKLLKRRERSEIKKEIARLIK